MHTEVVGQRVSTSPMFSLTTADIAPAEKIDYWREVVGRRIVPLDFEVRHTPAFEAELSGIQLGELRLSRIRATPHVARRSAAAIQRVEIDALVFDFVMTGVCHAVQDGREARIDAGSAVFCNASRPYALHFDQPFQIAVLTLPKATLSRAVAGLDRTTAQDLARSSKLFPLVMAYVSQLLLSMPSLDSATATRVGHNLADLVGAMIGEAIQQSPSPLSEHKTAALMRIRSFVEARLSDPELNPLSVSQALHLSPRYINQVLEAEGTSLRSQSSRA